MSGTAGVRAFGPSVLSGVIRSVAEDFRVDEVPSFEVSGEGEHLMLEIEKRGMNTAFVARQLAQWAGVAEHAVGYAGLKDRHAVTRQRFSVHLPKRIAPDFAPLSLVEGLRVVAHAWHSRKLPRGALAGNRFELVLRDVEADREALDARVEAIVSTGLPNFFGGQRFGHGDGNLDMARAVFAGRRMRREQRSIAISAARSTLFNAVLARRVEEGSWATGMEGDVWMLDGSRSVFGPVGIDAELRARAAALDIHATGPLWGRGEPRSAGAARALEDEVLLGFDEFRSGLEQVGLNQERRALRIRVADMRVEWPSAGVLRLCFTLPPGAYATEVLAQLGDVSEPREPG